MRPRGGHTGAWPILHITTGRDHRDPRCVPCDTVVLCAGQEPLRDLEAPLRAAGVAVHRVGGADVAAELDAKRAIEQATVLGMTL